MLGRNLHEEALRELEHDTLGTVLNELRKLDNWDDVYEWTWEEYYCRFILSEQEAREVHDKVYDMYFKPSGTKF